jgi:hypothetical protein
MKTALKIALLITTLGAQATTIKQFQPQGRVAEQSRATVMFNSDMVKLGEPEAAAPFTIDCNGIAGEGRWVDSKIWAWQMSRPLQAGERCIFTLKTGLTASNGETITGKNRFEFFGAAPRPWRIQPAPGAAIEEDQAFIINGGGALNAKSLENNLWCEADGVGQRLPARPVSDALRNEVLLQVGGMGSAPLVVSCSERLPTASKMKLVWGKGIQAANGTPTEKEESFIYKVREPFKATLNCEREKAGAPCSPLSALSLNFNAPFDAKILSKFRLLTATGPRSASDPNKNSSSPEASLQSVTFPGPLPQNAELTLEIPAGLKDETGRPLSNAASFPLKTRTGALPPLAKFPGNFGILELKEGGVLPVTLRNVEPALKTARLALPGSHRFSEQRLTEDADVIAAMLALEKFEQQSRQVKLVIDGETREVHDPYTAREFSFLAQRPGVAARSCPSPAAAPSSKWSAFRWQSRAITSSRSKAVARRRPAGDAEADVRAHCGAGHQHGRASETRQGQRAGLGHGARQRQAGGRCRSARLGCDGQSLWQGKTDSQGRALVDALNAPSCKNSSNFLFASARLGDDYSFVRSDWNEGIEPWRFGVETWGETGAQDPHASSTAACSARPDGVDEAHRAQPQQRALPCPIWRRCRASWSSATARAAPNLPSRWLGCASFGGQQLEESRNRPSSAPMKSP